jgi:diguanylate cyclase (GGDEF)-like protein
MPDIFWCEVQPSKTSAALREALTLWGYRVENGHGEGTLVLVARRPDPKLLPPLGMEVLWWVEEATPEEVSDVLSRRPGWVLRDHSPLEAVKEALGHLRQRDLGSEGWLRQMLHLATLDELIRLVLIRAIHISGAKQGAIWIRQDNVFFQRCGEGYPEAPVTLPEAASLVRTGDAWLICPDEQVGIIRLREPKGDPAHFLGWIKEVEDLLINAWNLEKSLSLSFKDDLTVAHNRRCLEVELPKAVREAAARGESVSLLFLDVDNLKALNSQFGHPTGSKVLTTVAIEAQHIIRAQDRIYRYGGDEFCIVIPGTSATGAAKLGERLIQTLQNTQVMINGERVPISVSIGIAAYPAHADGAEHLLERADRALFRAKEEGKGRVVMAT